MIIELDYQDPEIQLQIDKINKITVLKNHLSTCGTKWAWYICPKCQTKEKTLHHCNLRYCKKPSCIKFRRSQAFGKLKQFISTYPRGYHLSIGSNLLNKKQLERGVTKYFQQMRRKGYSMQFIKVFDIGKRKYKQTGRLWFHFHIVLFLARGEKRIDYRKFIADSRNSLNKPALFNNIGWRNTKGLINYFSQKIAGEYGHKNNRYYLPDLMSVETFSDIYHNARVFSCSKSLRRLIYITVNSSPIILCPKCETPMIFDEYEVITRKVHTKPPPMIEEVVK